MDLVPLACEDGVYRGIPIFRIFIPKYILWVLVTYNEKFEQKY